MLEFDLNRDNHGPTLVAAGETLESLRSLALSSLAREAAAVLVDCADADKDGRDYIFANLDRTAADLFRALIRAHVAIDGEVDAMHGAMAREVSSAIRATSKTGTAATVAPSEDRA